MNSIGVRVTTKEVLYAVCSGTTDQPILIVTNRLKAPQSYEIPDVLSWYREQFNSVCNEYNVESVVIRTAESNIRSISAGVVYRYNVEGVLAETSNTFGSKVKMGPLATIGSLLGIQRPKQLLDQDEFKGIDSWGILNKEFKEALIASVAALRL